MGDRTRAVIFDCDGVLVDSERLSIRIDQQVLAELGWELTLDEIVERFVGRSQTEYEREVEEHLGRTLPDDWDEQNAWRYRDAFVSELRPVPGIESALDAMTWPTCVASSGSHERMRFTLGLTGLWDRFDGRIFSATEVARGKPAPDLFLHAAESMGWTPSRCVVVEDSAHGVRAALDAGMAVVAYAGGVTPAVRLAAPGVVVIDDMADLPDAIREAFART
jgi:HAD superfamily hydrolase (TIGR01509 family)